MEKQQNELGSMADGRINEAEIAKYTIKDSVFTNLLSFLYASPISDDACRRFPVLCAWIPQNLDYP